MSVERILVVDDEPEIRRLLQEILEDEGYAVEAAANAAQARTAVSRQRPDVVLLDIWMPDEDGVTLLKHWSSQGPLGYTVIMMSGHGTVETAVEATRHGAFDYIEKPLSLARLLLTVRRGIEASRTLRRPSVATQRDDASQLVGASGKLRRLREQAAANAVRHEWLLAGGECGAGRRTLLHYLHARSPRHGGAFVDLGEPHWAQLLERALNHPQADALKEPVAAAQGGFLFVGDLLKLQPPEQATLLELLEASDPEGSDVRVAGMLGGDVQPASWIERGRLDPGLAKRFEAGYIHVPALREHAEDVPELLQYHADRLHREEGLAYRQFTVAAQNRLRHHRWPGNVAELVSLVRLVLVTGRGGDVGADEAEDALGTLKLRGDDALGEAPPAYDELFELSLKEARERFERAYLLHWLTETEGNVSRLAEQAGVERTHLYRKLRMLGIEPRRERRRSG
jgi:two-component system nitrogen regulation response regulator NtrX